MGGAGVAIALLGFSPFSAAIACCGLVVASVLSQSPLPKSVIKPEAEPELEPISTKSIEVETRLYRQQELKRITASLLAGGAILACGEEGCGKSTLANAITEHLLEEGFTVAVVEPATPKQMLQEVADQLGLEQQNLEGKVLTADKLKIAIADYLKNNTAFLIIDDAHLYELKFRIWLKQLKRQGVPMMLTATDPPRSDVFLNLPRVELQPLPESAIRELMEQFALERGIPLKNSDLARLQQRAGGNPMLAARCIDEEYLGLEPETGDHRRYADATPLILLAGLGFMVMRFVALGTANPALYIMTGSLGVVFMGISRLFYGLPKEGNRIR